MDLSVILRIGLSGVKEALEGLRSLLTLATGATEASKASTQATSAATKALVGVRSHDCPAPRVGVRSRHGQLAGGCPVSSGFVGVRFRPVSSRGLVAVWGLLWLVGGWHRLPGRCAGGCPVSRLSGPTGGCPVSSRPARGWVSGVGRQKQKAGGHGGWKGFAQEGRRGQFGG